MRKYLYLVGSMLLVGFSRTQAQEQVYDWTVKHRVQRSASQYSIQNIKTDKAGNVYTIGTFTDSIHIGGGTSTELLVGAQAAGGSGQYDFVITKQDADSNLIWIKRIDKRNFRFNDIYAQPYANGFEVDEDGNVYVSGAFPSSLDLDPSATDSLVFTGPSGVLGNATSGFVAKYNTMGELNWAKHLLTNTVLWFAPYYRAASVNVNQLSLSKAGDLYVSGYLMEATAGDTLTYDPGGQNVHKVFTNATAKNVGYWAKIDTANGEVDDMKFTKPEQSGNLLRFKAIPTETENGGMYVFAQVRDTFDIALEGHTAHTINTLVPGNTNYNTYLAHYDSSGAVVWANVFKGKTNTPIDFKLDGQGQIAFYLLFRDSVYILDNANYNQNYVQKYGLITGKYSDTGSLIWEELLDFNLLNDDEYDGNNLALDAFDNIYLSGTIKGKMFPGAVSSTVYAHAFARKYSGSGVLDWTMRYGSYNQLIASQTVNGNYIHVDRSNNLYTAGLFTTTQFVINPLDTPEVYVGGTAPRSIFLAKYTCTDTSTTVLNVVTCNSYEYAGNTYTESGTHKFHYWSQGGCDSNIILNLTINNIEEPFITVNNAELGVTSQYDTYQWLLNNQAISGATNSTHTVLQNGAYRVVVGLQNGCTDTSEVYDVTNLTSIKNANSLAQQISIYPNPTSHFVKIDAPVVIQWELLRIDGSVLNRGKGSQINISLNALSEGVYVLNLKDRDGKFIKTERIVFKK